MAPPAAARKRLLRKKRKNHKFSVKVRDPNDDRWLSHLNQKIQNKKKKKKATGLKLTELPADLLVGEILSGLHLADRLRFGATCKSNHTLITTAADRSLSLRGEMDELPWLATFSSSSPWTVFSAGLMLYHPIHRRGQPPYARFEIQFPREEAFHHTFNQLIASKLGWLLFCWPAGTSTTNTSSSSSSLLLFSPFNRRFIKLPDVKDCIDHAQIGHICKATFSCCPSSSDCVYFFLTQNIVPGKVTISTLKQRKKKKREWKTLVFDELIKHIQSVAYHDGLFYCLSGKEGANLAAYDHVHDNWTTVITSSPLSNRNSLSALGFHILEFHGSLILVVHDMSYNINGLGHICSLFEFNSSTKTWVQKTSLEDNAAIFLGSHNRGSSFAVSAPSGVANKIYFYGYSNFDTYPMYYSLKDGKSYLCHDNSSNTYWSSGIRDKGIWIQPPPPSAFHHPEIH